MARALDWETDGKVWPFRANSRFASLEGVRWHWQRFDSSGQPQLLLLHGTGASAHTWAPLVPLLNARFDIMSVDLPGQAFSHCDDADLMSMVGMAQSLDALLRDQLFQPVLVVGHSAGAALLGQMILQGFVAPDRLVAIAPAFMPWRGIANHLFTPMAKMLAGASIVPRLFSRMSGSDESVRRLITRIGSAPIEEMVACYKVLVSNECHVANTLTMMARWELAALTPQLSSLSVPVDLVIGSADQAVPPEQAKQAAALLPQSQLHWLHGKGHLVHEEQPEAIARLVLGTT
ncbi:MAG: alpha/beta fold hydrolase BchO [Burkholderiaceae bacterium]